MPNPSRVIAAARAIIQPGEAFAIGVHERFALRTELRDALAEYDTALVLVWEQLSDTLWTARCLDYEATVRKFGGDKQWAYRFGFGLWSPGFDSREAAGQAALDAIRKATP